MAKTDIVAYYRKHDDFNRYLAENTERVKHLTKLYGSCIDYFGQAVLDVACGGGVLGFIVEPKGRAYVGIDIDPDMVNSARGHSKTIGSKNIFILGDARSRKLEGKFDTITILGNALIHFDAGEFSKVVHNVGRNSHRGTYFLAEYRDVVSMLFAGHFKGKHEQIRSRKKIVSVPKRINTERGEIMIESVSAGKHNLDFSHAIWSPFIVGTIMANNGWKFCKRTKSANYSWLDVYQKS